VRIKDAVIEQKSGIWYLQRMCHVWTQRLLFIHVIVIIATLLPIVIIVVVVNMSRKVQTMLCG